MQTRTFGITVSAGGIESGSGPGREAVRQDERTQAILKVDKTKTSDQIGKQRNSITLSKLRLKLLRLWRQWEAMKKTGQAPI